MENYLQNSCLLDNTGEPVLHLLDPRVHRSMKVTRVPWGVHAHRSPSPCKGEKPALSFLNVLGLSSALLFCLDVVVWLLANTGAVPVDITFCFISTGKSASCNSDTRNAALWCTSRSRERVPSLVPPTCRGAIHTVSTNRQTRLIYVSSTAPGHSKHHTL